jgi:hypothetical protein
LLGKREYNLAEALDHMAGGTGERGPTGVAAEISQEIERRSGRGKVRGLLIPLDLPIEKRALTTTTGSGAVRTSLHEELFIDALRNRSVLASLGARVVDLSDAERGLVGIPRRATTTAVSTVSEG